MRFSTQVTGLLLIAFLLCAGCDERAESPKPTPAAAAPAPTPATLPAGVSALAQARRGFASKMLEEHRDGTRAPRPPAGLFNLVHYESPLGPLAAYVTPDPGDNKKHPAILWITGGDCNTIGDVWTPRPAGNDQSAAAYRNAGIVMMFPSLRGGNDNPGVQENFLNEVDDVLAAADYLARQPFVDADRLYLGGHSTGGTLALLTAESTKRFRAVFALGPVASVMDYKGAIPLYFKPSPRDIELRSPANWLRCVETPTFVFEGTRDPSNLASLRTMSKLNTSPHLQFLEVPELSHFSVIAPLNELIARKILRPGSEISFSAEELSALRKSP